MVKTLLKSVRQYKRVSIETPLFVTMEVILECTIPLIMSKLIDDMTGSSMAPILKYGALLLVLATLSLLFGVLSARAAATAGCGLAKNLRRDLYFKTQDFAFADIDKFSSSSLVTRMTTDVSNVQNAYQMLIRMAVRAPLMTSLFRHHEHEHQRPDVLHLSGTSPGSCSGTVWHLLLCPPDL